MFLRYFSGAVRNTYEKPLINIKAYFSQTKKLPMLSYMGKSKTHF